MMKRKMKNYIVIIIEKNKTQEVQVKANNKKEAKDMVIDVLTKCDLFKVKDINKIKLKCKRMWREK
ncbi:MAG: hypothetical protein IJY87_05810 [Bacilli bacterium]|nr:hypothetical protein [Bacilli bacterium]